MTDHLVSPDKPITIAGKSYTLCGSFKALKAIQHAFETEILQFLVGKVSWLSFDDLAKVVRIAIEAGGQTPPDQDTIEQAVLEDIGIQDARNLVGGWLVLATTPKRDREKKARELEEVSGSGKSRASRGRSTGNST